MKYFIIVLLLCISLFSNENDEEINKPRQMLESIEEHAIILGEGKAKNIYVFIDPICPFSHDYITKIMNNEDLLKKNSYYIFLYRLAVFKSDKLIAYIFESEDKLATLEEVVVYGDIVDLENLKASTKTLKALKKIADVGEYLEIINRPYIISFEKGSKYCKVSEGEASCKKDLWNSE